MISCNLELSLRRLIKHFTYNCWRNFDTVFIALIFLLIASKLSKMLLQEGGYEIAEECWNNVFECKKHFVFTKSGRLLCKYIAHLIIPSDITALPPDLLDIFKEIDKRGLSSVALPAIGTGMVLLFSCLLYFST